MKIAPTMAALADRTAAEQCLVHTGQHCDEALSDACSSAVTVDERE
jgi:UDP-N-acetylglucosamine 2-epimerase